MSKEERDKVIKLKTEVCERCQKMIKIQIMERGEVFNS